MFEAAYSVDFLGLGVRLIVRFEQLINRLLTVDSGSGEFLGNLYFFILFDRVLGQSRLR